MVNTSACTAEHSLLQRLQYIPETRTQNSCSLTQNTSSSSSTSKNTSSCFGLGRLSLAKLCLLSVLLLVTIAASSWPTGTSAAPRVARGLHLILPHRHSSTEPAPSSTPSTSASTPAPVHAHRRSLRARHLKARRLHHVSLREAEEPQFLLMKQIKDLTSCKIMEVNTSKVAKLKDALMFAQNHKDSVICTTEDWLQNIYEESSIGVALNTLKLWSLDLEHPLKDRVSKVNFTAEGKFVYKGAIGSLEEEMPKIVETLFVLDTLLNTTKFDDMQKECTFRHILNSVRSNTARAMELMKQQQCNAKEVIHYHQKIPRLPFFIALETIKVLTVLEYTYEQLVNNMLKG